MVCSVVYDATIRISFSLRLEGVSLILMDFVLRSWNLIHYLRLPCPAANTVDIKIKKMFV
jgi:hypothetical protein